MKKTFNYISVFILLITLFSGVFFMGGSKNNIAKAYITTTSKVGDDTNYIEITPEGRVLVKYTWDGDKAAEGMAYLIVVAAECSNYTMEEVPGENGEVQKGYDLDTMGNRQCSGAYSKDKKIFFMSGDTAKKSIINGSQKIHDSKYISLFDYYEPSSLVQVSAYSGFFKGGPTKKEYSAAEVEQFIQDKVRDTTTDIEYLDRRMTVYEAGPNTSVSDSAVVVIANDRGIEAVGSVKDIIFDTVIPALLVVLGIAATVALCALGYQIVKDADDSQQRSENIHRIRNILIGIVLAFIILLAMEPFIEFVEKLIKE